MATDRWIKDKIKANMFLFSPFLRSLCRLCGIILRKAKGPEHEVLGELDNSSKNQLRKMGCKAVRWPEVIIKVFKVDVSGDMETIHPAMFCHQCWTVAIRGGGFCSFTRTRVPEWRPHTSNCLLCYPQIKKRRGRKRSKPLHSIHIIPQKIKRDSLTTTRGSRVQRQTTDTPTAVKFKTWVKPTAQRKLWVKNITHCQKDHLSCRLLAGDLPKDFQNAIVCQVCDHLLSDPVQSPCQHLFCRTCIQKYSLALAPQCPTCGLLFNPSDLKSPAKAFIFILQALPLLCPREGCGQWVRFDTFGDHCLNHCFDANVEKEEFITDQNLNGFIPVNKGGRPRQHLLSLTRRAQKHRLKDLKNQVKTFADKEEGGDVKAVCLTLFLLALRAGNEHRQADELEAMMQGIGKLFKRYVHVMCWISVFQWLG